jgi:hypothetical protein
MTGQRIFRTADGRHVHEGDPDAAFLAYAEADQPPAEVLKQLGAKQAGKAEDKQADKPADKTRRGPQKKAETKPADES